VKPVLSLCAVLASCAALSAPRPARDTAFVGVEKVSVGVFAPLTYAFSEHIELRAHPILFLVAPNVVARVTHAVLNGLRITGEYGVSIPTVPMRLARGYLFPSDADIPWMVVPSAGVIASGGVPLGDVWTASADVAYRVRLGPSSLTPTNAPAPLEMALAPGAGGYRVRAGGAYDAAVGERWRLRGYGDVFLWPGGVLSPVAFRLGAAADLAVGAKNRFTFGAVYWNSDTGRVDLASGQRLRSHDILPTVDFIWAW
jgi:hypothetical protein